MGVVRMMLLHTKLFSIRSFVINIHARRKLKDILCDANDGENNAASDGKPTAKSTPESHQNDVESDSSGSVLNVRDATTTAELKKVSEGYGLFSV